MIDNEVIKQNCSHLTNGDEKLRTCHSNKT